MNRTVKIFLFGALAMLTACQPRSERPNIILMMADDLGWGDTGFNGNMEIVTPNMDKLADMGMTFSRFYSASAVCSPTRASCLTGRNPVRIGVPNANTGHLQKSETSLAEILKEAGYNTGHFGKWHLGTFTTTMSDANRGKPGNSSHVSIPTDHGFDEFFSTESKVPTWDPMIKPRTFNTDAGESLRYGWTAPVGEADSVFYNTRYWTDLDKPDFNNVKGNDSRVIMDRAIEFIERSDAEAKPFFSVIWFHAPHLPVVVPEEYKSRFEVNDNQVQLYYGSISGLDEEIGRLWKALEENNIEDNTLIFFCSDNGPEVRTPGSAGPFRGRKRDLYEGGIRVPAFVVWPKKIGQGLKTDYPAFTSDYLPTIIDILDLPEINNGKAIDGISLGPVLFEGIEERDIPMGFLYQKSISWVTHQYKLISVDEGKTYELYDLLSDPSEKNNIIESSPELRDELKAGLDKWLESVEMDMKELEDQH